MQKLAVPEKAPSPPKRKAFWGTLLAVSMSGSCATALSTGIIEGGATSYGIMHAKVNVPTSPDESSGAGCAISAVPPGMFCGVQTTKKDPSCPDGRLWKGNAINIDSRGIHARKLSHCEP